MNKYSQYGENYVNISAVLTAGESVIWSGKPKKGAFIINRIMTMAPFAILWLCIDGALIFNLLSDGFGGMGSMGIFMIGFFALHLMPVWIWLGNILSAKKVWDNTEYVLTNKRVIIQSGFVGMDYQSVFYSDINNVQLRVGLVDKILGVGDIYLDTTQGKKTFLDIENAYVVYPMIQKTVVDIKTDVQYPNALRPDTNPGYTTQYDPNQQ